MSSRSRSVAHREARSSRRSGSNGGSLRWVFNEIEPDSFHWRAERAVDDATWRREVDIRARRA